MSCFLEQAGNDLCENLKSCHMLLNSVGLPSSDMWLLDFRGQCFGGFEGFS